MIEFFLLAFVILENNAGRFPHVFEPENVDEMEGGLNFNFFLFFIFLVHL